jgi:hypothetical protein
VIRIPGANASLTPQARPCRVLPSSVPQEIERTWMTARGRPLLPLTSCRHPVRSLVYELSWYEVAQQTATWKTDRSRSAVAGVAGQALGAQPVRDRVVGFRLRSSTVTRGLVHAVAR